MFVATVEPAGQPLVIRHGTEWRLAFGKKGEAVLADQDNICLYQHNGDEYCLANRMPLPGDVSGYCNKAVSTSAVFVQDPVSTSAVLVQDLLPVEPTHQLSIQDLNPVDILHHKGDLLDVVSPSTLVYRQKRGEDDWIVTLHNRDGEMTLKPPPGRTWGSGLSVCRAGDSLVLVELRTPSMTVFTTSGNILLLFLSY